MALVERDTARAAHEPPDRAPGEMTLIEHLNELRERLIKSVLALVVGVVIAALFLTWPVMGVLVEPVGRKLVFLRPAEMVLTYFKVALITGAALAMPVIVYQVLMFILPALTPEEKRYVFFAVPGVSVAFIVGVLFGFFALLPFAVKYLLSWGGDFVDPMWSIGEYLSFVTTLLFWIGVSFEMPIVIFFLAKLGVVDHRRLASYRKYALLAAFVIAAIITPTPDPFNQTLVGVPLYLLFEIGVLLARLA
ncbi:MAG TPA: twin-arginine translocase subunit TatC [Chloroflexota bacterium]